MVSPGMAWSCDITHTQRTGRSGTNFRVSGNSPNPYSRVMSSDRHRSASP